MQKFLKKYRDFRIYLLITIAAFVFFWLLPWILKGMDMARTAYLEYGSWVKEF